MFIIAIFALLIIAACSDSNISGEAKQQKMAVKNITNATGKSVNMNGTNGTNTTGNYTNYCFDSDGGLNKWVAGYVTYNNYTVYDYCSNTSVVGEAICNNQSVLEWWPIGCNYACSAGACTTNTSISQTERRTNLTM